MLENFKALLVEEQGENKFGSSIVQRSVSDLPEGDVLVRVHYSSLNYKDALSASGNRGVTRKYPHTPGIDSVGTIVECSDQQFKAGDQVIVCGYDLGMNTSGGFGQMILVPAQWVIPLPSGLDMRESMILGTAGFTAALCIEKLMTNNVTPESGEILVTGATGGVGAVAVALLSKLGYTVVASTGKQDKKEFLQGLGASRVIDRNDLIEESSRPLLKEQWAGAVDVVGGSTLFNIIKSLNYGGSVACCGLVGSPNFDASVFPFILRGVNLLGVDSVQLPLDIKVGLWERLATDWKLDNLEAMSCEIGYEDLVASLDAVLAGKAVGRMILNLDS